jgi:hypothetical protein
LGLLLKFGQETIFFGKKRTQIEIDKQAVRTGLPSDTLSMKTLSLVTAVSGLIIIGFSQHASAQCTVATPSYASSTTACSQTGLTQITASTTTINSGKYYESGTLSLSGFTDNSSTVVYICGNFTLTNPSLNSGSTYVIEPGGSLTINVTGSGGLTINPVVVNYGTLTITKSANKYTAQTQFNSNFWNYGNYSDNGSVVMDNSATYNALSSSNIVISGDLLTNGTLTNNGNINVGGELTNNKAMSLGGGSNIQTDSLYMDANANAVTTCPTPGYPKAGLTITKYYNSNWNSLTTSSALYFCAGSGINSTNNNGTGPANYGSATYQANCTSPILPVVLLSFDAQTGYGNQCTLTWATAMETALKGFTIQSSADGIVFSDLEDVDAHGDPSQYTVQTTLTAKTYFRLRIDNTDGSYDYSAVVMADYQGEQSGQEYSLLARPNCVTNNTLLIWASMATAQTGDLVVVDMMGRVVLKETVSLAAGTTSQAILLPNLASGMYRLLFMGSQVKINPVPFTVIH